jgi:hypothetical protein
MSFPPTVADQVLLACGRHCVLCHRHVGLKIELHHILPKEAGGKDTLDNCIPLCFDCHADMRGYDHKHPKGRKYSEAELKARRDDWSRRYASSGGAIAHPQHLELDRAVFLDLRKRLPYQRSIFRIEERYSGAPIRSSWFDILTRYIEEPLDASNEFLDADLESARSTLVEVLRKFCGIVAHWTFPQDTGGGFWLPNELKYGESDEYIRRSLEIDLASNEVIEAYKSLVRLARRKLGVDVEKEEA